MTQQTEARTAEMPDDLYAALNAIRSEYRLRMNRAADLAETAAASGDMASVSQHSSESERCREAFNAMNRAVNTADSYYAALAKIGGDA